MAHITVSTKIIDGNLGDGWTNNYDAALALADLMRETWTSDLSEFTEAGHTVEIEIDVERNTSGCDCSRSVFVSIRDAENGDETYRLELYATESLTSENEIWDDFCANPPAEVVGE
jgi:hypothetical protein